MPVSLLRRVQSWIVLYLAGAPVDAGNRLPVDSTGTVVVSGVDPPPTVYNGISTVAVPGTAEVLAAAQVLEAGVQVKAEANNTGIVYVGDAAVAAANGYFLAAGETVWLAIDNLDEVYLDVSVGTDGAACLAS